jgi:hypothetical protein
MNNRGIANHMTERTAKAVAHYWRTRTAQRKKQEATGKADQGLRSAVTGGAQMKISRLKSNVTIFFLRVLGPGRSIFDSLSWVSEKLFQEAEE